MNLLFLYYQLPSMSSRCLSIISSHSERCLSYFRINKSRFRTSCSFSKASRCISTLAISSSCTLHKRAKISASSSVLILLGSSWKRKAIFFIRSEAVRWKILHLPICFVSSCSAPSLAPGHIWCRSIVAAHVGSKGAHPRLAALLRAPPPLLLLRPRRLPLLLLPLQPPLLPPRLLKNTLRLQSLIYFQRMQIVL